MRKKNTDHVAVKFGDTKIRVYPEYLNGKNALSFFAENFSVVSNADLQRNEERVALMKKEFSENIHSQNESDKAVALLRANEKEMHKKLDEAYEIIKQSSQHHRETLAEVNEDHEKEVRNLNRIAFIAILAFTITAVALGYTIHEYAPQFLK